jgi:hypothetical protein
MLGPENTLRNAGKAARTPCSDGGRKVRRFLWRSKFRLLASAAFVWETRTAIPSFDELEAPPLNRSRANHL